MVGQTISHYHITEKLGEGGMGVVYKAEDTKLERTVALKFLAGHLLNDEEAKARFLREAKAAAGIHHPNICPVYEISEAEGRTFLSMAFIEGEPLEAHIERGPLALKEALDIGRQIAEGLEAAHEKGVVHRDIKPANVMVDAKGRATIMDFGLAHLTEASRLTKADQTMGTVAYMSPEQAQGMEVDNRSDIWALGVVLYEMVRGQRPFQGEYDQALLFEIVHQEPEPLTGVRTGVPIELELLVVKCLAKDAQDRYGHADEIAKDLRTLAEKLKSGRSTILRTGIDLGDQRPGVASPAQARTAGDVRHAEPRQAGSPASTPRYVPWMLSAALAIALIVIASLLLTKTQDSPERPLMRLEVDLGRDINPGFGSDVALSLDGTRLAIAAGGPGDRQIHTRLLSETEFEALDGTDGARAPFFSPDGKWIAFHADGQLKKVSVEGGAPVPLCEAPLVFGGSWDTNDTIIASPRSITGLVRVSAAGGEPQVITQPDPDRQEDAHRWPQILPDGKAVLFTAGSAGKFFDETTIDVQSFETGERRTLVKGGVSGYYLPTGHLIYLRRGTLFAAPMDAATLRLTEPAVPVLVDVSGHAGSGGGHFSFSETGVFLYTEGSVDASRWQLTWVTQTGALEPLISEPGRYYQPRVSPDGRKLAVSIAKGTEQNIWIYDLERLTMTRLTFGRGPDTHPVWFADGRHIAYRSERESAMGIVYVERADGSGKPQQLVKGGVFAGLSGVVSGGALRPYSISQDGGFLFYDQSVGGQGYDIWVAPLEMHGIGGPQAGEPEPFLQTAFEESSPAVSLDGRWVAYVSNESGRDEIYVRPFPGPGGKWSVSDHGVFPSWSPNGRELFYESGDRILAVSYSVENGSFRADKPRVWADVPSKWHGGPFTPDSVMAPDGKRFAVTTKVEGQTVESDQRHVTMLLNFFEELRRRVPLED